jgi:membrane associated rhomboid family serine protease
MIRRTFVLIIACTAVFLLQLTGIFNWQLFAFAPALALQRPWTFVTSIFLHADFSHLFFNMFALFMFGIFLENRIGARNFLILFFLSGIAGSIGYMITASNPMIPAIGASGAIYGIIGALAVIMPFMMVWLLGGIPMPMIVAAVIWIALEVFGLFSPSDIAHGAHLGGVVVGIMYGIYLRMSERRIAKQFNKEEEINLP